ncbi:hypothetical protein GCM10010335_49100 [Streptomyces galbus]|nr:hypothetical protein GCM10010335_49100 [Streptomyces galbus]
MRACGAAGATGTDDPDDPDADADADDAIDADGPDGAAPVAGRPAGCPGAPGRRPGRAGHRPAHRVPAVRSQGSRACVAALSVGSIPVPLTAGGAHAPRPDARRTIHGAALENPFPCASRARGCPDRSGARQAHLSTVGRGRLSRAAVADGCPNAPGPPVYI